MFNINDFKQKIKIWLEDNPEESKESFLAYCRSLIPEESKVQYSWLLDQVSMWFDSVTFNREGYIGTPIENGLVCVSTIRGLAGPPGRQRLTAQSPCK